MYSSFSCHSLFIFSLILSLVLSPHAADTPRALSVAPSMTWYGDDGVWSAVSLRVGSPQQWVDVIVSTASSETWVVSPFGCDGSSTRISKRGGIFDFNKSSTWQTVGHFELGLDTKLGFTGNGDYGRDVLEFGNTGVTLNNSIVGSINTTDYWLGYFGLGIIPGSFNNVPVKTPISGLVEDAVVIPSYSYGFTAGATYQGKSVPCSLTLGGFDANRLIPHNISFELNPTRQPEAFLNSISVASSSSSKGPLNWSASALKLLEPEEGISVIIDSSTPFLWLPKSVCEGFASALGLTYNDTLALYTFDGNASRRDDLRSWNLDFTFSLSDTPTPSEAVNITLPYAAFDLQLTYPYIPNTTFATGDKYYFPLRRAANKTQYTLGRAFLQEAYMITDYERNNFSIHQAVHTANPLGNTSIIDITRPSKNETSNFETDKESGGFSLTAKILIAVGAVIFGVLLGLGFYLYQRRRRQRALRSGASEQAETPIAPKQPGEAAPAMSEIHGMHTSSPIEVSADAQLFELAVPLPPVELDGNSSPSISAYGQQQLPPLGSRQREWNEHSISGSSPDTLGSGYQRSSGRGFYSPVLSPQTPIVPYSSLPSPPPRYQPPTPRADQSLEITRLQGQVYGRNGAWRSARVGKGRIGDSVEDSKR